MAQGKQDIFSTSFSGEHAHFGDILRSARERMDAIDKEMATIQAPSQPTLNMSQGRDNNFASNRKDQLVRERSEVVRNTRSFVDKATAHNNVETRDSVIKQADYLLDEKNIRTKDEKSLEEMSETFEHKHALMKEAKELNDPRSHKHIDRASDRFNSLLNHSSQNPSSHVTRFKDIAQPSSASARFNQSLGYNVVAVDFKQIQDKGDTKANLPAPASASDRFNETLQFPQTETKEISEPSMEDMDISDSMDAPQSPDDDMEDKDKDD